MKRLLTAVAAAALIAGTFGTTVPAKASEAGTTGSITLKHNVVVPVNYAKTVDKDTVITKNITVSTLDFDVYKIADYDEYGKITLINGFEALKEDTTDPDLQAFVRSIEEDASSFLKDTDKYWANIGKLDAAIKQGGQLNGKVTANYKITTKTEKASDTIAQNKPPVITGRGLYFIPGIVNTSYSSDAFYRFELRSQPALLIVPSIDKDGFVYDVEATIKLECNASEKTLRIFIMTP